MQPAPGPSRSVLCEYAAFTIACLPGFPRVCMPGARNRLDLGRECCLVFLSQDGDGQDWEGAFLPAGASGHCKPEEDSR